MATYTRRETAHGPSFLIRSSCGYDASGRQIMRSMTWKPKPNMSAKAMEKELQRQLVLFDEECAGCGCSGNVKFETFSKTWFAEYAEKNLRKTTLNRTHQFEERTYKAIGHVRLDKLTTRHIQKFIIDLQKPGENKCKAQKGLSPKTVRNYLSYISSVLTYAKSMGMIKENPCDNAILPAMNTKEREIYTVTETIEFLEKLSSEPLKYQTFFILAIYGGFRRGELLGLEWKDIDYENNLVSIKRSSLSVRGEKPFTDTTKTKESCRTIKLPDIVFSVLKQLQNEQDGERKILGENWVESDRLFTTWNGEPMRAETPRNWLVKFCKRTGMKYVSIHSFRHLNATLLIGSGTDVRTVSAALGHSTATTTLNIYSHAFAEQQAKASEAIANTLNLHRKVRNEQTTNI